MKKYFEIKNTEINPENYPIILSDALKLYEMRRGQPVYKLPDGTRITAHDDGYFTTDDGEIYYPVNLVTVDDDDDITDIEMYGVTERFPR